MGAQILKDSPLETHAKLNTEYILIDSFINERVFLNRIQLVANKSGRITFSVLMFDFCTDQISCMHQFENSPQILNKFNWRLFSLQLNLTEGFNDFIITPHIYLNNNSFISWFSNEGLIASQDSNHKNTDFILESSTKFLSFKNFTRHCSVVFFVEKLIKSYLYKANTVYLEVGVFPVWVYLQNSFYQFVSNMSVYDGECSKYTRLFNKKISFFNFT